MVRPVAVIPGRHQLKKTACYVVNTPEEARKVFAEVYSPDDYLRAPRVDYSRYSAILVCRQRAPFLISLELDSLHTAGSEMTIQYSEDWIGQIFFGLNDTVAESPCLLIIVPKWKKDVLIYRTEAVSKKQAMRRFQSRIKSPDTKPEP